jgi:hypothetical protein
VAGTEGKDGEGGGTKDVLGETVSTRDGERAPPAGIKEDGLLGVACVLEQHGLVFAIIGMIRVRGGQLAIRLCKTSLNGLPGEGLTGGEVAKILK